jgi:predicted aspartyl protease
MRHPLLSVSCLLTACLSLSLPSFAGPPGTTTVSLGLRSGAMLIVPVKINGCGPFDFVLDTGSTVTIVDGALFRELGLKPDGNTLLTSVAKSHDQLRATAQEVSVNGLGVAGLRVAAMENFNSGTAAQRVRGILGETSLNHFDVLIDNEHRQVTLDSTTVLANALDGEHLPMALISNFEGSIVRHRPIVSVTVPSYNSHPMHLLLDTGATALAIFPHAGLERRALNGGNATAVTASTPNGELSCATWKDKLHWGGAVSGADILVCRGATDEKVDNQGSMPTHIFRQILISHGGMYVVVNPVPRSTAAAEAALISASTQ